MSVLQRTGLTTSRKVQCAAAALTGQRAVDSKTALSEAYGISRPTVHASGSTAQSVLRTHFEAPLLEGPGVTVRVEPESHARRPMITTASPTTMSRAWERKAPGRISTWA